MDIKVLKEWANSHKIQYHPNIGVKKLYELITAHCNDTNIELPTFEETQPTIEKENTMSVENEVEKPTSSKNARLKKLANMTFADSDSEQAKRTTSIRLKNAQKLVRCVVTTNNPNKVKLFGEFYSVRNAKIEGVTKFVPYGVITHIPEIILNVLKEKKCQLFKKVKKGEAVYTEPVIINEFSISILDDISAEELEAIKTRQLANKTLGD